jgi:hypothetical protein
MVDLYALQNTNNDLGDYQKWKEKKPVETG